MHECICEGMVRTKCDAKHSNVESGGGISPVSWILWVQMFLTGFSMFL